jgi:hypothetical protein
MMASNEVKDKADNEGVFNKQISAGSVFDNGGAQASNVSSVTVNYDIGPHGNYLDFEPVSYAETYKALKAIDTKKSAGPDNLDHYLLKVAACIITEPVAHIFNASLDQFHTQHLEISSCPPTAERGDPSDANNYRPISKLPILAKVYESLVNSLSWPKSMNP